MLVWGTRSGESIRGFLRLRTIASGSVPAEIGGRQPDHLFKAAAEIVFVFKSADICDFADIRRLLQQQIFGFIDAEPEHIFLGRNADSGFEPSVKLHIGEVRLLCVPLNGVPAENIVSHPRNDLRYDRVIYLGRYVGGFVLEPIELDQIEEEMILRIADKILRELAVMIQHGCRGRETRLIPKNYIIDGEYRYIGRIAKEKHRDRLDDMPLISDSFAKEHALAGLYRDGTGIGGDGIAPLHKQVKNVIGGAKMLVLKFFPMGDFDTDNQCELHGYSKNERFL